MTHDLEGCVPLWLVLICYQLLDKSTPGLYEKNNDLVLLGLVKSNKMLLGLLRKQLMLLDQILFSIHEIDLCFSLTVDVADTRRKIAGN